MGVLSEEVSCGHTCKASLSCRRLLRGRSLSREISREDTTEHMIATLKDTTTVREVAKREVNTLLEVTWSLPYGRSRVQLSNFRCKEISHIVRKVARQVTHWATLPSTCTEFDDLVISKG